ncbi:MAG: GNAT family N-acetyltransferase, partial [Candidatus Xenobia bacterium]
ERQTLLHDFAASDVGVFKTLLSAAEEVCREAGDDYLVAHILQDAAQEQEWFSAAGFEVDMVRIFKQVQPTGTLAEGYRVRRAGPDDRLFILLLSTIAGPFTIPPLRNCNRMEVLSRYLDAYSQLDFRPENPALLGFIAERISDGQPVGQTMFKIGLQDDISAEPMAYVYDLAVHPDHMGNHISLFLISEAEKELQRLGIRWLAGDISAANPRPLHLAQRYLGFHAELARRVRAVPREALIEAAEGVAK